MEDITVSLNEASIREQRRTHALRGSLFRAIFRHRMWMWAERLRNRTRPA
ncbi:hypothetical protein [Brevundimonas sp.]|nr:hypothetical protein [Brevundimonas sp.]